MIKRGMSAVIVSLIMVLLVLVATGVVWVVIRNIISEGTEQISLDKLTMDLEIKSVEVISDSELEVRVARNPGGGELEEINFVVSDGANSQVIPKSTTLEELEEETFTIPYSGLVKEVTIAPTVKGSSGTTSTGSSVDNFELEGEDAIITLKPVSWWKFDGNADDEIGTNHGTEHGTTYTNGVYGQAASFAGTGDYIDVPYSTSLNIMNDVTISLYIKTTDYGDWKSIIDNGGMCQEMQRGYMVTSQYGKIGFSARACMWLDSSNTMNDGEWRQFTFVIDGGVWRVYENGVLDTEQTYGLYPNYSPFSLRFSRNGAFKGVLDEVMIFNRTLTDNEIKALSELDLS